MIGRSLYINFRLGVHHCTNALKRRKGVKGYTIVALRETDLEGLTDWVRKLEEQEADAHRLLPGVQLLNSMGL
jgi:hypothetical protein